MRVPAVSSKVPGRRMAEAYRHGVLHTESVSASDIAADVGTPVYCYSATTIERNYADLADAFTALRPTICYAVKANSNLAVLKLLGRLGAGADIVSEGELRRALAAGIPANKIVFSGVGKTEQEIEAAIDAGILQFNVESGEELYRIAATAEARSAIVGVAFRVNPDVAANSNDKISTGHRGAKFGLAPEEVNRLYAAASASPSVNVCGLTVHIGSQINELAPFHAAFTRVRDLAQTLVTEGFHVPRLDLGGGIGVAYGDEKPLDFGKYARLVEQVFGNLDFEIIVEPGRCIVADAGILVTEIITTKHCDSRKFIVVDAAFNDLIRPGLYDARHRILPLIEPGPDVQPEVVDIVGPVCESTDTFTVGETMPEAHAGDRLAILDAGAYGAVMSSTYNSRPLIPEVLVRGDEFDVIRQRGSYDAMLETDRVPEWLQ